MLKPADRDGTTTYPRMNIWASEELSAQHQTARRDPRHRKSQNFDDILYRRELIVRISKLNQMSVHMIPNLHQLIPMQGIKIRSLYREGASFRWNGTAA